MARKRKGIIMRYSMGRQK